MCHRVGTDWIKERKQDLALQATGKRFAAQSSGISTLTPLVSQDYWLDSSSSPQSISRRIPIRQHPLPVDKSSPNSSRHSLSTRSRLSRNSARQNELQSRNRSKSTRTEISDRFSKSTRINAASTTSSTSSSPPPLSLVSLRLPRNQPERQRSRYQVEESSSIETRSIAPTSLERDSRSGM